MCKVHKGLSKALVWRISIWHGRPAGERIKRTVWGSSIWRGPLAGRQIKWCGRELFKHCHRVEANRARDRSLFRPTTCFQEPLGTSKRGLGETAQCRKRRGWIFLSLSLSLRPTKSWPQSIKCPERFPLLSPELSWSQSTQKHILFQAQSSTAFCFSSLLLFWSLGPFFLFFIRCQQHKFTQYIPFCL